jgi:hypothetical protein
MAIGDRIPAGTEIEANRDPRMLSIGQDRLEFGPWGPVIRALGLGFVLGVLVMMVVAVLSD